MLPNQISAVDCNIEELVESMKLSTTVFMDYLISRRAISYDEREVVESKITSVGKLSYLLNMLKSKDPGWSQLLRYLRENHLTALVNKLQNDACETDAAEKTSTKSCLAEFALRLAEYYQANYANVPTMWEEPKHVKDVWVPLQIDGRQFVAADRIDHIELLNRLKSNRGRNIALIKGDPGMGKTTLAKKIAYDWAVNNSLADAQQFSLVLAVPLRSVGKFAKLDQLAIDYFLSVLDLEDMDKAEIIRDIKQLKSQLLIILDGLDEYRSYDESPFKAMFAAPFHYSSVNSNVPLQMLTFKLIITSRPYACERVNKEFFPLRFTILPPEVDHLSDFVQAYCQTTDGKLKVTEYLKVNNQLVIQVPLILTFVCYLADSEDEIPTNLTNLYDNLLRQMIGRESRQGKLVERMDIQKWKESNVVKSTSELAFKEISRMKFEFTKDSLDKSHVTNESFICGFLLHKFDFAKELLKAEFPHRSIQEFFAALHCYKLMLTGCNDELDIIIQRILSRDSQFGRFLFGLCSLEGQFVQMTDWLSPSLDYSAVIDHSAKILWSPAATINHFGTSLFDCTTDENILVGQRLQQSIGLLKERITSDMRMPMHMLRGTLQLYNLSHDFAQALQLVVLAKDSNGVSADWILVDHRQLAQLAVVSRGLPEFLVEKFDQINIFIWKPSVDYLLEMKWKSVVDQLRSLPPVTTFIMTTMEELTRLQSTIVFVRIRYGQLGGNSQLVNFRFEYDKSRRREFLDVLPDEILEELVEDERKKFEWGINLSVTVNKCSSQFAVICTLVRLSLL